MMFPPAQQICMLLCWSSNQISKGLVCWSVFKTILCLRHGTSFVLCSQITTFVQVRRGLSPATANSENEKRPKLNSSLLNDSHLFCFLVVQSISLQALYDKSLSLKYNYIRTMIDYR